MIKHVDIPQDSIESAQVVADEMDISLSESLAHCAVIGIEGAALIIKMNKAVKGQVH